MKLICTIVFTISVNILFGQAGAAWVGLGRNLANTEAQFCMANNPAALQKEKINAGIFGQNRFAGTSINFGSLAGSVKLNHTTLGLQAQFGGTEYFNRHGGEIAVGQQFSDKLSVGLGAGYTRISQGAGYAGVTRLNARVGARAKITNTVDVAFVLINPWIGNTGFAQNTPQMHLAAGYAVNAQTKVWGQFRTDINSPPVYGIGMRYQTDKKVVLRAALQTGFEPISAGMSVLHKNLNLELATAYHIYLGFSPAFSLAWKM